MNLREAIDQYGSAAYLLTVSPDGPHAGLVDIQLANGKVTFAAGNSAAKNIDENPNVSLLWPPQEPGGYTLIVNGIAALSGDQCDLTLTKSVLHRPGAPTKPGCSADCVRLAS